MPTTIDELQIGISADANDVDKQIDSLVKMLDKLQKTLSGTGGSAYKKYTSGTKKATKETRKLSNEVKNVNNNVKQTEKTTDSLARSFGKFYANYFLFVRALKGVWGSIETTADYVESFNYFTVSMGKIASKWDKQWKLYADDNARNYSNQFFVTLDKTFKKLSGVSYDAETGLLSETGLKNLGLNLQEVTQYAAQLGSMMDAVGQSGETTLATTNAFVKLAGDISSLYNIDYAKAAEKIRSVLQGQSRAGYGFGWDTTMASLQATADKLDLSKPVSEMSQMEKQQLRILTILEQSRVAWGDQANTINTVANQLRIFKNNSSEIGMVFGQLFIPMLQRVLPYINGFSIAIKRLLSDLAGLLGIKIEDVGQGFGDMGEDMEDAADGFDDLAESAKKAKAGLRGFDELKTISLPDTDKMSDSLGDQIDISDEIASATKEYEEYWQNAMNDMKNRAEELATTISNAFDFEDIAKNVSDLFKAIQDFNDEIEPFTDGFGEGFLEYFKTIGDITFNTFTEGLEMLADVVGLLPEDVLKGVGKGLGVLAGSVLTLVGINKVTTTFDSLSKGLKTLSSTLIANPILSTFALATGILTLIELADKKAEIAVSIEMGDIISDLETLSRSIGSTQTSLENIETSFSDLDNVELNRVYKKWKKLNNKVGELTDDDKGLLKAYADRIKELFPEAKTFIDENGKAYKGMANNLDEAIKKAITLASVQTADELTSEAVKIQIQAEMDLSSAQKSIDEILDYFKEQFPELTDNEIEKMLESYSKTGNLFVPGTGKSPFVVAAERNPEKKGKLDWLLGDIKHFNQLQKLEEEADKYLESLDLRNRAEKNLADADAQLNAIIQKSIELNKEYSKTIKKTEDKTSSLSVVVNGIASGAIPNLAEQMGFTTGEFEKATKSVDNFVNSLGNIPNGKNTIRPGLIVKPYATGGFPEDGLFMANHNELVGKFSNGKNVVINNKQITQGIADAVYPAVYNAVTAAFSNKGTEPIRVFVGDRELTDIVVDGINQRTRAGKQPLYGW